MPRYGQLVIGPAGSGKSTYCTNIQKHCENAKRVCHVVNLDPAAESFTYSPIADVRDLVQVDDAMEDEQLALGPNGGLIFCMEYLASNLDWLLEAIDDDVEDDYILFDCPGQIELYSHLPVMRQLIETLERHCDFRLCSVFLIDSQFLVEPHKFVAGGLAALSAMVALETPYVGILSKVDLLSERQKKRLDRFLEPDFLNLLEDGDCLIWDNEMSETDSDVDEDDDDRMSEGFAEEDEDERREMRHRRRAQRRQRQMEEDEERMRAQSACRGPGPNSSKFAALGRALASVIEDYSLLRFLPFDLSDESTIEETLGVIDSCIQYGEEKEPRMRDDALEEEEDEEDEGMHE